MPKRSPRKGPPALRRTTVSELPPEARLPILLRAAAQLRRRYADDPGIRRVAIGFKETDEALTRTVCARFYVRRKLIRPGQSRSIPRELPVRVQHQGRRYLFTLLTDIVVAPNIDRLETHAKKPNLAPSIFNHTDPNEYGTATALVRDGAGVTSLLSAAHVAAGVLHAPPAPIDSPIDADTLPSFGTLQTYPSVGESGIDAALVKLNASNPQSLVPRPNAAPVTVECPESDVILLDPAGFTLYSFRRQRSMTFIAAHADFEVKDVYAEGPVTFPLLLEFECGAQGGDSGAMVVDAQGRAVGMHIMGRKGDSSFGYSVPIGRVLRGVVPGSHFDLVY